MTKTFCTVIFGGAFIVTAASILLVRADDGDEIGDLMERVHSGRRSPMRQTEEQISQNAPTWPIVDRHLPSFARMAGALQRARKAEVRDASDGYAKAVAELTKSVQARNVKTSRTALKALRESCSDCHYKGGPGGKLDDD